MNSLDEMAERYRAVRRGAFWRGFLFGVVACAVVVALTGCDNGRDGPICGGRFMYGHWALHIPSGQVVRVEWRDDRQPATVAWIRFTTVEGAWRERCAALAELGQR